jgi:hypothetical protein
MKTFLFSAVAAIGMSLCSQSAQARSWRVNSNPDAKANFASINDAMASLDVFNGDTIYLDPGCVLNNQTISKGVTVIGPGYNLEESTYSTQLQGTTKIPKGSNSIKIEGCNMAAIDMVDASNVTVERCKIASASHNSCSNISYLSCFIYGATYSKSSIEDMNHSTFTISNCILLNKVSGINNTSTITNNVIIGWARTYYDEGNIYLLENVTNSSITNNIIINTNTRYSVGEDQRPYYYKNNTIKNTAVEDNNTISNNVLSTEAQHAFANYPNNKFIGATAADIFTLTGAADAMYKLKEGSPAIGYGTNGYDCGAFSGPYPYVLSGRPRFLPYIYEAIIPNQPTDGKLNVTLKIKTQNE